MASWSFTDRTYWSSDQGCLPISFTNLASSILGDGSSLVVATNVPAWLNYPVIQSGTGITNLVLNAAGSLTFWFAPNWSTTNGGPGQWAQLIEVGEWTSNALSGYWGLSIDPPGSNLWFRAQDGAGDSYGLSAPILWTTNYFHYVVLTYSSTNVSLHLDGALATNDSGGLRVWPGTNAIAGGMFFGSDTNGFTQAGGYFNTVETFSYPLDSNDVQTIFNWTFGLYLMSPWNTAMADIASASSNPSTNIVTPDVITGAGDLQWLGAATPISGTNACFVWMTNVTATVQADGSVNIAFTIQGGKSGSYYDVFATGAMEPVLTNALWYWMGQGTNSGRYRLNIVNDDVFLILGTPQDSDGDGLTDAYELLVSHTDPHNPYSNLDGILDGWDVLLGLNPQLNNVNTSLERANYGYTPADWLNVVTGVQGKAGAATLDNEGNVLTVSQ